MAFNADKYISVIVEQIGNNFLELHEAVANCQEFLDAEKEYLKFDMDNGNIEEFIKLFDKYSLYKKSVSNLVCNYDLYKSIEPLSVGLFGEWGSGKTHLLKLIEAEIIKLQYEKKVFPKTTIPVFFNAWRFEKEEHLIVPLFQTLLASIESYDSQHLGETAKKQLGRTKERLKILSFALAKGFKIPRNIKSTIASLMSGDLSVIVDFIDKDKLLKAYKEGVKKAFITEENLKDLLQSERIESVYMNIPQWIEKITIADNINFVFLIDDLDRCLPENTLKMLESIKLFLDVPSCAFVLAIDDDVVERGVAYHYRDYLQQNNNTIIYLDKQEEKNKEIKVKELPITGHEYLEKMIQLPFRIPVISKNNVYNFLETRYRTTFETILNDNQNKISANKHQNISEPKEQQSQTDVMLEFFAKTIPPKPRKLKRAAMLFQTKVKLLDALQIELRPKLIAKITLLELFTPKLLRYMQNNDYVSIYDRLVHFKSLENPNSKDKEKEKLSLADITEIRKHINSKEANYQTKDKEKFHKLIDIVEESRGVRMVFDLDAIFDTKEQKEDLQLVIEMMKPKEKKPKDKVINFTYLTESSFEKLFLPNDAASWADAFRDNKALASGEALLFDIELKEIIKRAKKETEFAKDPEWVGIVANYISDSQYIELLKELYDYRFADINGKFKIGIYQVTFAEYDRYCQIEGINVSKPRDKEWGRGKRPVIYVSWHEANKYAKWLSDNLGATYKLPSSDDWYLACNNGKTTRWHFGNEEKELKEYAWYSANSGGKTHIVGELKPNEFGLYDMHGNVWEWCEDWYDKDKNGKVLRGGSWDDIAIDTVSSIRGRGDPSYGNYNVGFRLQRTLP